VRTLARVGSIAIAAVDVGNVANTGWWQISSSGAEQGGRDLNDLATLLADDLTRGEKVALGFEAPLFIPLPSSTEGLGRQRIGEVGRPWCAGAGASTLAFGLQEAAFVLTALARKTHHPIRGGLDLAGLASDQFDLVLWEAFVSGPAKDRTAADPHIADARAAAIEFQRRYRSGHVTSDISETEVVSLGGAVLLGAGLSTDLTLLSAPCTVVKPPAVPT
jgi:hypothetical protein